MRKFLFAITMVAFMSLFSVTQAHVLDGAKEWNGHYYKVIGQKMNWDEAKKFCESVGGHLATAETSAENEMLKELVMKYGNNRYNFYLIGGIYQNNVWRWITGKPIIDYFDWVNGAEGTSAYKYLCLNGAKEGKWVATHDNVHCEFICEWENKESAHDSTM